MPIFTRRSRIPAPAEEVFAWHARPGAFERLTPPWQSVEIVERSGGIEDGARVVLRLRAGPFSRTWVAEHWDYAPGRQFRDRQLKGPFARWDHTHRIEPDGDAACYLEDRIDYALPLGPLGAVCGGAFTRRTLDRLFTYRHTVTRQDMVAHAAAQGGSPMHIAVTGSSGLLGSALVSFLAGGGHRLTRLVRSPATAGAAEIEWNPQAGRLEPSSLEGLDGFVHLAGENIAAGRWTAGQKARIRDSRINSTRLLSETLAKLSRPPKVLVCASAIGFYGDRGADLMSEDSPAGSGFLAEVCEAWEAASQPARDAGIRTVLLRIGVVLSPAGGALARLLLPFRLGAGGVIGSGDQYWSWIGLDDVIGAIHHALIHDALEGAVNAVAPQPVTNRVFTTTLGTVLGRPTLVPLPGFAARLVLGEMADALLLASTRVEPARLLASGYSFRQPELEGALRHCLGKQG